MKHYLYAIGAILCWASLPAATGSGLAGLTSEELMFFSFTSAAIYLGCVPLGLSFFLWNRALTGGNMVIIGFLSYFTPPLAVFMVAIIHGEKISSQVIFGMVIILAAAIGGKMSLAPSGKKKTT